MANNNSTSSSISARKTRRAGKQQKAPARRRRQKHRPLLWAGYLSCALAASLLLAWLSLAKFNFLYPVWYHALDIDQTIAVFGPQNRNRNGFATTTEAEHQRLFAAIVSAIQNNGEGLQSIRYHAPNGQPIDTLLTPPEIQHLQDVARLIRGLSIVGWAALAGWLGLSLLARQQRWPMPPTRSLLIGSGAALALLTVVTLLAGPVSVFYTLHELIFPTDHAWFFYYQDSLMTTLMQAPVIFAPIATCLALTTLLLLALLLIMGRLCVTH